MASLIKNQIVKHLSKFTKNLSPDKIQLSTLKGEGELTNLELNEEVLMELMDLPTWLKLNTAVCNKVSVKIPWSKLKSQPIQLFLDEVKISMEMCDELRKPPNTSGLPSYSSGGKYGFGDRVVDGMYLQINVVVIDFRSKAFQASLNLSRIIIQSKTPTWRTATDLQYTRISEKGRDFLLTFKEISWQTLRLEADCTVGENIKQTTPLRLITNQSKIRILVKKRYSDCSIVGTKLQFIMDDLLWIITDSQMKAAVVFARHLKDNIDKASEQSKALAAASLRKQRQVQKQNAASSSHNHHTKSASPHQSPASALFNKFDITESSYHVLTGRIDLHICDDVNVENRNRLVDGGAIGIAIMKINISHYPSRAVGESRKDWPQYDDNMAGRDQWTADLIENYKQQLKLDMKTGKLHLKETVTPELIAGSLVERLTLLTVEDFFITSVSSDKDLGKRPAKILMSDKKALFLPTEMSAIHIEQTEYFFDHKTTMATPCPNAYVRINPIRVTLDTYTMTWFNSFALSLAKDVEDLLAALPLDTKKKKERMEMRVEALMPKIVLPVTTTVPHYQPDRPDSVQMLISRVVITNNHSASCSKNSSKTALNSLLERYNKLTLQGPEFPSDECHLPLISADHTQYAESEKVCHMTDENKLGENDLEVMSIELEQFWMEFTGVRSAGNRPVSFLESFPITIWMTMPSEPSPSSATSSNTNHTNEKMDSSESSKTNQSDAVKDKTGQPDVGSMTMGVVIDIGAKICAQLNHYQFVFLMRLADSFTSMGQMITDEAKLHSDLFDKHGGKEAVVNTLDSSTVILRVKELQFAMLAMPDMQLHESHTLASIDRALNSPDQMDGAELSSPSPQSMDQDAMSNVPDITYNEDPQDSTAELDQQIDGITISDSSPLDADSGIASSITGSSFTGSTETDLHLERSAFYHNPNSGETKAKRPRSSFYAGDTLLPPGQESRGSTGNKFASAFSKMAGKMKNTIAKMDESDNWDSLSIASGMSDDYDLLAELTNQEEEAAFISNQTGGLNDDEQESVLSGSMADRPKQMVSVILFKICDIEVGMQTVGKDMVAKVALESLVSAEKGNMSYDDFQAQQLADMNVYEQVSTHKKPIRVRYSAGPAAAELAYMADEKGFAHIQVSDYELSFLSSTIDKLAPLFADEKAGEPLPMLVEVANFDFTLKYTDDVEDEMDNKPSPYATDKASDPVNLHINKLSLTRTSDGKFTIQGETLLADKASILKQKTVPRADKSTSTDPSLEQAADSSSEKVAAESKQQAERTSSSAQLLDEMRYLQQENKALTEQIMRLNEKLLEKDHQEFERVESAENVDNLILSRDLDYFKKETKLLREQMLSKCEEIDTLQSTRDCMSETIKILKLQLVKDSNKSSDHADVT